MTRVNIDDPGFTVADPTERGTLPTPEVPTA
jgi:hypothetical protein